MTADVLVIGAGPAGAVSARELARRNLRVLLVDKARFPRHKVCGSCLNGVAIDTLQRLGLGHVLDGAVPLTRMTVAAGRRAATFALALGAAMSRQVLDTRLVDAAVQEGVEFRPETTAISPLGRERAAQFDTAITIVASGLTGGEATPDPASRIGGGVIVDADAAPHFFEPGTIFMATSRGGYVGLVRLGDGRLDVAAAFDPSFVKAMGGLGPAAGAVLGDVGWPLPVGLNEATWKGTPALSRRPARLAGDRAFAVGDAAGYVEPFTGEGMAWAISAAAALAPIAARAVHAWDDRLIAEWEATFRQTVGNRQWLCRTAARVLRSPFLARLVVRALGVVPALARPVVAALGRPSPIRLADT